MDGSGGLDCAGVHGDGPGAALVFADGEEGNEAEKRVGRTDETSEAAFLESVAGEEFGGVCVAHFGKFGFDFAADGGGCGILRCGASLRRTGEGTRPYVVCGDF